MAAGFLAMRQRQRRWAAVSQWLVQSWSVKYAFAKEVAAQTSYFRKLRLWRPACRNVSKPARGLFCCVDFDTQAKGFGLANQSPIGTSLRQIKRLARSERTERVWHKSCVNGSQVTPCCPLRMIRGLGRSHGFYGVHMTNPSFRFVHFARTHWLPRPHVCLLNCR